MNHKIKIISNVCIVLVLILTLSISSYATSSSSVIMADWGETLAENSKDMQSEDIYAVGKNAIVTNKDVAQAVEFYLLSGMDEQNAKEEAVKYTFQREALYQAAIENGYSVTDEEVWEYLEELKDTINHADNKEDIITIMNQFETENDYWNFEFSVYQKNLPIQRYVHDLEESFMQSSVKENEWDQYFEQMKENLVLKENYQIINK